MVRRDGLRARAPGPGRLKALCLIVVLALTVLPAAAQESPRDSVPAASPAPTVEELQRLIEEQKRLIEEQQKRLEAQEQALETQSDNLEAHRKEIEALKLLIESMTRRLDELQDELPQFETQRAIEDRLKRVESESQKTPELPPDVVSAGDFPGSIRIPGTDAAVKFGGRVRVALVTTLDPLGSKDRFLTNSIPVNDAGVTDKEQTNINANTSRFNFELRTPTGAGQMRAFIEGDFFGSGNSFRLRHAYGQFHGFLFGQTWSTFADPAADQQDLDFEGVSSENVVRQPQMRYTWRPAEAKYSFAAAIETPQVSVTNGVGSDVIPDFVGRYIWRFKETGHLQVATVLREIRAAPLTDPSEFEREPGWGIGVSGVVPFRYWNLTDRFIFQLIGICLSNRTSIAMALMASRRPARTI